MFELENRILPRTVKHLGPPVERMVESERFLSAHQKARDTVSGPWIEKDRWVAHKVRRHFDAKQLLKSSLINGGRNIGVSSLIADSIKRNNFRVLTDLQIAKLLKIEDFSKFMSKRLAGKPYWLT